MLKLAGHAADAELNGLASADKLVVYEGSIPPTCEDSATGAVLLVFTLASPWAASASNGFRKLRGLPIDADVLQDGTVGYFRFLSGSTCTMQGTAGGASCDLIFPWSSVFEGDTMSLAQLAFVALNSDQLLTSP